MKIHRYIAALTGCMLMLWPLLALAQPTPGLQAMVHDESGNPVEGALIYANEGVNLVKTNAAGEFYFRGAVTGNLLVEASGFEPRVFEPGDYGTGQTLVLKKASFLSGEKDKVRLAFGSAIKANVVNAVSVLNPNQLRKYDNTQTLSSALTGMLPGLLGSSNIRGIGTPLFIVDGLPRDISTLNLAEVEQISVLKDINSAILYGNDAVNGVVLVTTKRGEAYKRQINAQAFYGISRPSELPEYLSSADYMGLYNEARRNDRLENQYSPELIEKYRSGNPYRYPSVDYYSSNYLKSIRPFSRATVDFSGGNSVANYYSNIGWSQTGSLYNFGEGKGAKSNVFNIRGNVDMKINSWIKSALDAVVVLNNSNGPRNNYWQDAAVLRPNLFSPLLPISLIDPENAVLKQRKNDIGGMYLLGGTTNYQTNPIATAWSGGANENIQRTFSFNNRIDFDLGRAVQGLAFHTNFSFDYFTRYDQFIDNKYSVYQPVWDDTGDRIVDLRQFGEDVRSGTQNVGNASYRRRIGFYGLLDYNRTFNDVHTVTGSLLGFLSHDKAQESFQGNKNANLGLRLTYGYLNKYLVDFSSAYVNSVKLAAGNRTALSPSLGVAWIVSNEDFMAAAPQVNFLKLRLSAGEMNSDAGLGGFYYYDDRYTTGASYSWYEGTRTRQETIPVNSGNPGLSFEKRREVNFGVEAVLFDRQLSVDANIFASTYSDLITRPQSVYPSYFTNYIPFRNFGKNAYKGAELGLSYQRRIGDFHLSLGANALYSTSRVKKRDELYVNSYQYRTGNPVDARYGLVADGLFSSQAEIDNHAVQAFGKVKPGDIKYADQNKDGIVDANDEKYMGRWQSPFSYGLNLKVSYRNFTLFARGNGRTGADGMLSSDYYWADGDDKYSSYVLNRWTEATKATATYPRLSSIANTNNYRNSSFWLYSDNYFMLDRVQLTYDIPVNLANKFTVKQLSVFADASNLATIAKNRRILERNIGIEPQFRSFSIGINAWF